MPSRNRSVRTSRGGRRGRGNVGGVRGGGGAVSGRNASTGLSLSVTQPGMNIPSMPLFGLRTRRNLSYSNSFVSVNSGAGVAGAYVFSTNGAYDPNVTGTGGQPMGFDQMMLFYNHYTVLRSRCRLVAAATSATSPCVGLALSGSATPLTSIEQIMEVGKVNWVWLNGTGVAQSKALLSSRCNLAKFQGVQNIMDDPDMRGDSASNPVEQSYYIIYVWYPVDSTVVTVSLSVFLEYDTMFHEPRSASLSLKSQAVERQRNESKNVEEFVNIEVSKRTQLNPVLPGDYHSCPVAIMLDQLKIDRKQDDQQR